MNRLISVTIQTNAPTYRAQMQQAGAATQGFGNQLQGMNAKVTVSNRLMGGMRNFVQQAASSFAGFVGAQAVIAGVVGGVRLLKDEILGFDDKMTQSLAIMSDVSAATRDQMEQTAMAVSEDLNMSAASAAESYFFLASAGLDANQSISALPQVAAFAKAGMFDMATATDLAADAQTAMGLRSADAEQNLENLTRVTDNLTGANILATGEVEDFARALTTKAAAQARLAGLEIESVTATLAVFAEQGVKGRRAGQAYTIVLRDLQEKAINNAEAFDALGIAVFNQAGEVRAMPKIIGDVEDALAGMSTEQQRAALMTLGFTAEGLSYMAMLLGTSTRMAEYEERLRSMGGITQEIADKQMKSLLQRLGQVKQAAINLGIEGFDRLLVLTAELGTMFGPAFQEVGEFLEDIADQAAPVVVLLAKLGGAAVLGALKALAVSLEATFGFLNDHREILAVLAALYAGTVVTSVARATMAFIALQRVRIGIWLLEGAALARAMVAAFLNGATASGAFTSALGGLGIAVSAFTVGAAAFALVLGGVLLSMQATRGEAKAMVADLTADIDTSSLDGIEEAIFRVGDRLRQTGDEFHSRGGWAQFGSMAQDVLIPFHNVEDSAWDQAFAIESLNDEYERLQQQWESTTAASQVVANAIARSLDIDTSGVDEYAESIGRIGDEIAELAGEHEIDIAGVWETGSPEDIAAMTAALEELWTASQSGRASNEDLTASFQELADETASAGEQLEAYNNAIAALFDPMLSSFEAATKFGQAVNGLGEAILANGNTLDAYTEQGQANRDALSGAARAALDHALAVAEETGSVEQANEVLGWHVLELSNVMRQAGLTDDEIALMIETMGLTPERLQTLIALEGPEAAQAWLDDIGANLDALDGTEANPSIDPEADKSGKVPQFENELQELAGKRFNVDVDVDANTEPARDQVEAMAEFLERYDGREYEATADANNKPGMTALRTVEGRGKKFDRSTFEADLDAETAKAMNAIKHATKYAQQWWGGRTFTATLSANVSSDVSGAVGRALAIVGGTGDGEGVKGGTGDGPGISIAAPRSDGEGYKGTGFGYEELAEALWQHRVWKMGGVLGPVNYADGTVDEIIRFAERSGVAFKVSSSFRKGAITSTGNQSYHSMNRAVDFGGDLPGIFNAFLRIASQLKELIYTPAGGKQIKNGSPHMFSGGTIKEDHYDHVHVALARGAILGQAREDHVAQIAPAGAWRVWAEDETGGESYIPLHPSKRDRSLAVLRQTAGLMGMLVVDPRQDQLGVPVAHMAAGGVLHAPPARHQVRVVQAPVEVVIGHDGQPIIVKMDSRKVAEGVTRPMRVLDRSTDRKVDV